MREVLTIVGQIGSCITKGFMSTWSNGQEIVGHKPIGNESARGHKQTHTQYTLAVGESKEGSFEDERKTYYMQSTSRLRKRKRGY